jgi:hypothetical protein
MSIGSPHHIAQANLIIKGPVAEMQPARSAVEAESVPSPISCPAVPYLSESVAVFFQSVSTQGYPQPVQKEQPWRKVWIPQSPPTDGKLLIACPRNCDHGIYMVFTFRASALSSLFLKLSMADVMRRQGAVVSEAIRVTLHYN